MTKYHNAPVNYIYSYRSYKLRIKSTDIDCCVGTSDNPDLYLVDSEEKVKETFRSIIDKKLDERPEYKELEERFLAIKENVNNAENQFESFVDSLLDSKISK
jgi:hypothetical protein